MAVERVMVRTMTFEHAFMFETGFLGDALARIERFWGTMKETLRGMRFASLQRLQTGRRANWVPAASLSDDDVAERAEF